MSALPGSSKPSLKPPSHSRSRSRAHDSHNASEGPLPYLPHGPDGILLPDDSVTEENVELLHEFVHPSHRNIRREDTEATLVAEATEQEINETSSESDTDGEDEDGEDLEALNKRPWYRRPSPYWLLSTTPFSSIAMSACAAPRIEIYTFLACRVHKPEYDAGNLHYGVDIRMRNFVQSVKYADSEDANMHLLNYSYYPISGLDTILPPVETTFGTPKESKDTNKCASDPVVQAAAAKIIAVMTTTMGILSCLTTAFWGSLSDRFGRLRVLSISVIGLLFNDVIFIAVFFFSRQLPGGYWFLLLGPIVEGILGGLTSMVAAVHAYIADVSAPSDRSRQFSLGMGLLFVGMALGPSFGALLVHLTHTPMAVFYLATGVHVLLALYVWTVVPESLPKRTQRANRRKVERRRIEEARAEERERQQVDGWKMRYVRILRRAKRVFSFLSPLSVFAPVMLEDNASSACFGKKRRDWSLTLIAASFGFTAFLMASFQYAFQYAAANFGWTSEELGYWLTLVGASRAVYLTLILPLLIKVFNRPKQPIQLPIEPSEPLIHDPVPSEPSSSTLVDSPSSTPPTRPHSHSHQSSASKSRPMLAPHTPAFDLRLARLSLMWEFICYTLIPLAPTAQVFSVFGCLAAWGGGFGPAVQALALEMYVRRNTAKTGGSGEGEPETGRLFGALSVVQSMCSQIFGPTLYGVVFVKTVSFFPTAIFWLSTLCVGISMVCLLLVRLPRDAGRGHLVPGHISGDGDVASDSDVDLESAPVLGIEREATLVDTSEDSQAGGTRKRHGTTIL